MGMQHKSMTRRAAQVRGSHICCVQPRCTLYTATRKTPAAAQNAGSDTRRANVALNTHTHTTYHNLV